ncbi:MAG TPA: hypothetical protein VFH72_05735, partial [Candidatus Baltobacteraceae bacterium]|nr:hypothetical protein [Candidatus Baltobacteraceae bacterium]
RACNWVFAWPKRKAFLRIYEDSGLTTAFAFQAGEDGVCAIYGMRNPDKLRRLKSDRSAPAPHHTDEAR